MPKPKKSIASKWKWSIVAGVALLAFWWFLGLLWCPATEYTQACIYCVRFYRDPSNAEWGWFWLWWMGPQVGLLQVMAFAEADKFLAAERRDKKKARG